MKTLVTHISPHLDDIAAIWLTRKFLPEFKGAKLDFIGANQGNQGLAEDQDILYIGVGRGKYDEHKGDLEDCAATLVWKDIKKQGLVKEEGIGKLALEELIDWVRLGDLGRLPQGQYDEFTIPAFIRPKDSSKESSKKAVELGEEILDRVLEVLKRKQQSLIDWQSRIEFQSRFGFSAAVKSETVDREFCKRQNARLFVMYSPKHQSVQFFTPSFDIDLAPIYEKVKQLDPQASWFLHQSHHMVICGSSSAPDSKPTKLTFEQLIEAAKNL